MLAALPYEWFNAVSAQSTKFEEHKCLHKWQNIVSSYAEEPKGINQIMLLMKSIGINVQLDYSQHASNDLLVGLQFLHV